MALKPSKRGMVSPFIVMDVMQDAADLEEQGKEVVHLEVGQPSTGIPRAVLKPLQDLMEQEALGYTVATGIPELRQRLSRHYKDAYGADVSSDRIFITTGSSAGFQLAFLSAFDAGQRVALASPGYPAYRHILSSLGLEPVLLETTLETRYQPTADMLSALSQPVDGLILASPSNPTGTIVPDNEFVELVNYCRTNDIRLISDEIYHGITYGVPVSTAATYGSTDIVINSFSKYFSMTGWRIGWLVVPDDLKRSVECLAQNHYISPPTISQWAAFHVFDARSELDANVARYAANRDILLKGLPDAGLSKLAPSDGAFYLYADLKDISDDSITFCRGLLREAGVAVTPGVDFDPDRGQSTLRISFAGSTQDMHEAVRRIKNWLNK